MIALLMTLVAQAAHHGEIDGANVAWSTVIAGPVARNERFVLVTPLPRGFVVTSASDLIASRDEKGAIDAFVSTAEAYSSVRIAVRGPREGALVAPILAGQLAQRVTLGAPARFVPHPSMGLEPHVGYITAKALDHDALDRALRDLAPDPGPGAIYVTGSGPLIGDLVGSARTSGTALAVGFAFAAVVAGLLAAHKGLAKKADRERSDALLQQEIDALTPDPEPPSASSPG